MKKIFLGIIALIVCIASFETSAQNRFGAVVSVNHNTPHFNQELIGVDPAIGYSAGLISDLALGSNGFGINASLLYTQRSGVLHLGDKKIWAADGFGNERTYLHYIEIPIHIRYMYVHLNGFEEKLAPYVFAGPSFSILAGHNHVEALKYSAMAFSMQFGIGAQIYNNFHVSAMYDWGLSYAVKTKLLTDFSARNRCWKLTFTYFFKN